MLGRPHHPAPTLGRQGGHVLPDAHRARRDARFYPAPAWRCRACSRGSGRSSPSSPGCSTSCRACAPQRRPREGAAWLSGPAARTPRGVVVAPGVVVAAVARHAGGARPGSAAATASWPSTARRCATPSTSSSTRGDARLALAVERDGAPAARVLDRAGADLGLELRPPRAGGHRHLRQQVRVLLHPPAAARHAQEPLRQGRRLPAVVPARQLHHAQRPRRSGARAHRGAAAVAALRLGARHRPRAAAPAARRARGTQRRSCPDWSGWPRRASACTRRSCCARTGTTARTSSGRCDELAPLHPQVDDHRDRAGRASRATASGCRGSARSPCPRRRRCSPTVARLAAALPGRARQPLRVPRRRGLPAGGRAAAAGVGLRGVPHRRGRHRARPALRGRLAPRAPPARPGPSRGRAR